MGELALVGGVKALFIICTKFIMMNNESQVFSYTFTVECLELLTVLILAEPEK